MKTIVRFGIPVPLRLIILLTLTAGCFASPSTAAPEEKRPSVLVVYADWCPSCQQLKPTLALINEKYRGKIHFVRYDITSEETEEKSKREVMRLGLAEFFEKNHEQTSLVVILSSSGREIFRTVNDYEPQHYEAVLDRLLQTAVK
jgi:thiol-disulfide isomerase/thioredoxin